MCFGNSLILNLECKSNAKQDTSNLNLGNYDAQDGARTESRLTINRHGFLLNCPGTPTLLMVNL